MSVDKGKYNKKDAYLYPFGTMMKDVIIANRCTLCGGCLSSCPINCIGVKNNKPTLISICHRCGMCYTHCPRTGMNFEEIERGIYGRIKNENEKIGIFESYAIARAKDKQLNKIGQDGGVITALLKYALKKEIVQGVVNTKKINPNSWQPVPHFSKSIDIEETAGAIYSVSASNQFLAKAYYESANFIGCNICLSSIALVGTPCQIESIRKMQFSEYGKLKITDIVKFTISTFCWGNYYYDKFNEFIQSKGYDLSKITKISIKEGILIGFNNLKELFKFKISELESIKMNACSECNDLTGELSDISVGGQGTPPGWSFIILRSKFGEALFKQAVEAGYIELKSKSEADEALKIVIDSSEKKKKVKRKNIESTDNPLIKSSHRL